MAMNPGASLRVGTPLTSPWKTPIPSWTVALPVDCPPMTGSLMAYHEWSGVSPKDSMGISLMAYTEEGVQHAQVAEIAMAKEVMCMMDDQSVKELRSFKRFELLTAI
jgi:hypothetical protein